MRYLVTGAAGFIGSQLLRALLEQGHDATGWDAYSEYYDPALKEENARGLPVSRLDLAADTLEVDGFDGVFHLAGQPGVASFGGVFPVYVRQNVLASQRLFEAAAAAGVRVVFASSSSIYGDARGRSRRTGSRSSPASISRGRTGRSSGSMS
jgi:UDP-glucuronate 4-epimerase